MTPAEEEAHYLKQRHNDMKWLFGMEPEPDPEPESGADHDSEVTIRPGLQEASDKARPKKVTLVYDIETEQQFNTLAKGLWRFSP